MSPLKIGQCAAACVIAMLCPHHGIVYTVPAHTVCTQAISSLLSISKAGRVRIADSQIITLALDFLILIMGTCFIKVVIFSSNLMHEQHFCYIFVLLSCWLLLKFKILKVQNYLKSNTCLFAELGMMEYFLYRQNVFPNWFNVC